MVLLIQTSNISWCREESMNSELRQSVLQWVKLSDNELDSRIANYIENNKLDFIFAFDEIYFRTQIIDANVLKKLSDSFIRLAGKYIDDRTKGIIRKWERMSDDEIEQQLLKIYFDSGDTEIHRIFKLIYTKDMSVRAERIFLDASSKIRRIDLLKMIERWKSLSDADLTNEVTTELVGTGWNSSTSHFIFVNDLYVNIQDPHLRQRVDNVLLAMAEPAQLDENTQEKCGRAIYVCAKLQIPGTRERLANLIKLIKDPCERSHSTLIHWVNDALLDCPIPDAEKYLATQLEAVPDDWPNVISSPKVDYRQRGQYMTFLTAHNALLRISKTLADKFARKLKLKD